MNEEDEKHIAAKLAKILGMMCVRNTMLEDLHAGIVPISETGDYSDVVVIDATGRKIPWTEVSHFDDDTMRDLMRLRAGVDAVASAFRPRPTLVHDTDEAQKRA